VRTCDLTIPIDFVEELLDQTAEVESLFQFTSACWPIVAMDAAEISRRAAGTAVFGGIPGDCRVARSEAMTRKHGACDGRA